MLHQANILNGKSLPLSSSHALLSSCLVLAWVYRLTLAVCVDESVHGLSRVLLCCAPSLSLCLRSSKSEHALLPCACASCLSPGSAPCRLPSSVRRVLRLSALASPTHCSLVVVRHCHEPCPAVLLGPARVRVQVRARIQLPPLVRVVRACSSRS